MDEDELEMRLLAGESLCLLDDLVLDIGEYARYHPGGAFLISQNIGRDASKFFYGGYTMANKDTTHGYAHSNYARKVASSLAVATLNTVTKVIKAKIDNKQTHLWQHDLGSFVFKSQDGLPIKGFKQHYKELTHFGKHLLCQYISKDPKTGKEVKSAQRHYTIANCMK